MAINIEMSIKQSDSTYEILYPKTLGSLIDGKVSSASVADTATSATSANSATSATKLATARSIRTNLANTSAVNFDGSSNITPGITGILGVANGGTGVNSLNSLKSNLGYVLEKRTVMVDYIGNGDSMGWITPSQVYGDLTIKDNEIPYSLQIFTMDNVTWQNISMLPLCVGFGEGSISFYMTGNYSTTARPYYYSPPGKVSCGGASIAQYSDGTYKIRCNGAFNVSGSTYSLTESFIKVSI